MAKWFTWGDDVLDAGYAPIPNLLIIHQAELGLTSAEVNLICQAAAYFRQDDTLAPSGRRLAGQMGLTERQVRRVKNSLISKGYLKCTERWSPEGARITDDWDFSGLLVKCRTFMSGYGDTDVRRDGDTDVPTLHYKHTIIHTTPTPSDKNVPPTEIEKVLSELPYWKPEPEADKLWLAEFSIEYPELSAQHIKECRDFNDGRRARHKGDWKNRLRNWMKINRKKEDQGDGQGIRAHKKQPTAAERRAAVESWGK